MFPLGVYSPNDFCSFNVNGKAPSVSLRVFKEKKYLHDSSFLLSFASVLMAAETAGLNMQPKARYRSVTVVAQVSTRLNSVTLQVHRFRILLWQKHFSWCFHPLFKKALLTDEVGHRRFVEWTNSIEGAVWLEINVFKSRLGVYIGFCPPLWMDAINSHIVPGSVLAL